MTQLEQDLTELTHDQLRLKYAQACRLLGDETKKVKRLEAACHDAKQTLHNIDHSSARWAVKVLTDAINKIK